LFKNSLNHGGLKRMMYARNTAVRGKKKKIESNSRIATEIMTRFFMSMIVSQKRNPPEGSSNLPEDSIGS
jgi:hypothetical protein